MIDPNNNSENINDESKAPEDEIGENSGADTGFENNTEQDAEDSNPEHSNKGQGPSGEDL
jgi:hypothetical protein